MGKTPKEKKYIQKFRQTWLTDKQLRDWIVQVPAAVGYLPARTGRRVPGNDAKAHCKFCKCELIAKYVDLVNHSNTQKHVRAAEPFSTQRQMQLSFPAQSRSSSAAEGAMAMFVCAHSAISSCDHLGQLCRKNFMDSEAGKTMQMHRTKCSEVVKNVLSPYFKNELLSDIQNGKYSLPLDESNDISVNKLLGIGIIYYSEKFGKPISTFLTLTKLEECNAQSKVDAVKKEIEEMGLSLTNLMAIGTDNASVMVGVNNGVYVKLKEEVPSLILIKCLCHSPQLAVSHSMTETLPRNLEFLIHETYNWFSKSALRQLKYTQLYQTINCGEEPLRILQVSNTRWLSIEPAVIRTLDQWLELKTHFDFARRNEKCYTAEILYNMYCDEGNMLYLYFLKPILSDIQVVNKAFQSEKNDHVKLLNDLTILIQGISRKLLLPTCRVDPLQNSIDDYLDPKPYLGHSFEKKVEQLRKDGKLNNNDEQGIRERCKTFLLSLFKQLKQRLPENVMVLKKISLLSVDNVLKAVKEPIQPLLEYLGRTKDIDAIESQLSKINLIDWTNKSDTMAFWDEVKKYRDASGRNPFKELVTFALSMLILPYSNAPVERIFSQLNLVKNKTRNKMSVEMTNAILSVRFGLKRNGKCYHDYVLPPEVLQKIGTKESYKKATGGRPCPQTQTNECEMIDFTFE